MKPMSTIVVTLTKLFSWFIILFGTVTIINGHTTPGGGFQGGAIVATFMCFILVAWGGKKTLAWVRPNIYSGLESAGLLIFFALACLGFPNSFAFNFLAAQNSAEVWGGWLPSCGTISLMNVAVGLEVVGALSLTVIEMYEGTHFDESDLGEECGHDRI